VLSVYYHNRFRLMQLFGHQG